jgi:hypothetical protein
MADNTELNAGSGGDIIAADDIGGVKFQRVKLIHGADGVNDGDISDDNPLPVHSTLPTINKHLLNNVTSAGAGAAVQMPANLPYRTFHAILEGTGAVSATVLLEVSNDNLNWLTIYTFNLSGTDLDTDGFNSVGAWDYVRGNVSTILGTSATVNLHMGV